MLLRLARFEAMSADALYQGVAAIPWQDHVAPDGTIRVEFVGTSRAIRDERFGAVKTKDAVVDVIRTCKGRRPDVAREHPDVAIHVHLRNNVATVSLDLSGSSLHLRTPGRRTGVAPLKETLAATMLLLADWPRRSRDVQPFLDPMCGSGTLVLEAAGIAHDLAPGLARSHWGFTRWLGRDDAAWRDLVGEAEERRRAGCSRRSAIHGSDRDARAIGLARENAKRLGLGLPGLQFEVRPLEQLRPKGERPGLLVANPPYGERLATIESAAAPHRVRRCAAPAHARGTPSVTRAQRRSRSRSASDPRSPRPVQRTARVPAPRARHRRDGARARPHPSPEIARAPRTLLAAEMTIDSALTVATMPAGQSARSFAERSARCDVATRAARGVPSALGGAGDS